MLHSRNYSFLTGLHSEVGPMEAISAGRPVRLISGRSSGDDSIYKELIVHPIQARNDLQVHYALMRACKMRHSELLKVEY